MQDVGRQHVVKGNNKYLPLQSLGITMRVMWAVTGSTRASVSPAVWLTKEVWTFSMVSMTCGSCDTCTAAKCVGLHKE